MFKKLKLKFIKSKNHNYFKKQASGYNTIFLRTIGEIRKFFACASLPVNKWMKYVVIDKSWRSFVFTASKCFIYQDRILYSSLSDLSINLFQYKFCHSYVPLFLSKLYYYNASIYEMPDKKFKLQYFYFLFLTAEKGLQGVCFTPKITFFPLYSKYVLLLNIHSLLYIKWLIQ